MSFATELSEACTDIRAEYAATVNYLRGDEQLLLSPVAKGDRLFKYDDDYGITQRVNVVDWLIPATTLRLVIPPVPGDRITEQIGNTTFIYEVASVGKQPCWKYDDPGQTAVRVHTFLVDSINPET